MTEQPTIEILKDLERRIRKLDRNCIGFEIDPQWEPIYHKRLKLDNTKLEAFLS